MNSRRLNMIASILAFIAAAISLGATVMSYTKYGEIEIRTLAGGLLFVGIGIGAYARMKKQV